MSDAPVHILLYLVKLKLEKPFVDVWLVVERAGEILGPGTCAKSNTLMHVLFCLPVTFHKHFESKEQKQDSLCSRPE